MFYVWFTLGIILITLAFIFSLPILTYLWATFAMLSKVMRNLSLSLSYLAESMLSLLKTVILAVIIIGVMSLAYRMYSGGNSIELDSEPNVNFTSDVIEVSAQIEPSIETPTPVVNVVQPEVKLIPQPNLQPVANNVAITTSEYLENTQPCSEDIFKVAGLRGKKLNIRQYPSIEAPISKQVEEDDSLRVLDKPYQADNFTWLPIATTGDNKAVGWVVEQYLTPVGC